MNINIPTTDKRDSNPGRSAAGHAHPTGHWHHVTPVELRGAGLGHDPLLLPEHREAGGPH